MEPDHKRGVHLGEAVTGAIGILMVGLFLGFMAVDIGSIPLFVITVAVLAMAVIDLVQTLRERNNGGP